MMVLLCLAAVESVAAGGAQFAHAINSEVAAGLQR